MRQNHKATIIKLVPVWKCIANAELLGRTMLPASHWVLAASVRVLAGVFSIEQGLSLKMQRPSSLGVGEGRSWVRKRTVRDPEVGWLKPIFHCPFSQWARLQEGQGAQRESRGQMYGLCLCQLVPARTQDAQQHAVLILGQVLKGSPHLPSRSSYFWKE